MFEKNWGGQIQESPQKGQFVRIPRNMVTPVIVYQPDCPLQFEKVGVFEEISGGAIFNYTLKNHGNKPIKEFSLQVITSIGTGEGWGYEFLTPDRWIMPGETFPRIDKIPESKIIVPEKKMPDEIKSEKDIRLVVSFMVIHVKFADGTGYDDTKLFKKLSSYYEKSCLDKLYIDEEPRKK